MTGLRDTLPKPMGWALFVAFVSGAAVGILVTKGYGPLDGLVVTFAVVIAGWAAAWWLMPSPETIALVYADVDGDRR